MGTEEEDGARKNCCSSSCSHAENKSQKNVLSACLSEDTMFDVLTRLPAKYLFSSARSTCKSWAAMICRSDFVKTHLLRAKPGIFLQSTRHPYGARFLEIKDNGEFEVTDLYPFFPGRFLNSCDGLTLLFEYATGALHVANPVTLQAIRVPNLLSSKLMYPPCAIVRIPRTGEFKLFASVVLTEDEVCYSHWYVLRLGEDNSWKEIAAEPGDFEFRCTPIYTGVNDLYWITEHRVIVMDVDKQTFRHFPLPQGHHRWHPQYLKIDNSLASIIFLGGEGFQVHKFDTDSGGWTLYHQMGGFDYPTGGIEVLSEFFGVWINQELIIKTIIMPTLATLIFCYNVKTGTLRKVDAIEEDSYDVGLHTNSLIPWKDTLTWPSLQQFFS